MDTTKVLGQAYRPRVIDQALNEALSFTGAVVIEGARATGKTMTALNQAESYVFIDDPHSQTIIDIAPKTILAGATPRLLDEWQLAPQLWNLTRRAVDANPEPGQFILTGSAVPSDDITRHTGAGRFLRLRQRTMTWFEKMPSSDSGISINDLFNGIRPEAVPGNVSTLDNVIEVLLTPGFPAMTALSPAHARRRLSAYLVETTRTDVQRLESIRHEPLVIEQLIKALARSSASEVTFRTLASDVRAVAPDINEKTVSSYVELLERLFIVEPQRAWATNLRSRARLRTSPKMHLVDPALAAAILGADKGRLMKDFETLGLLFESSVVHDLTVFADALGGEVFHYRDSNGHEMDAVIALQDGRWGAVEIKLGVNQLARGIESLNRAVKQIDTRSVGEPAFRLVVTGTGPILTAEDGTITAPLRALRP